MSESTPAPAKIMPNGDTSHTEEDFFDASQPATSQPDTQAKDTTDRPRLCKSVWTGKVCSVPDCKLAHPPRCSNPACFPRRQQECIFWHTVRASQKKTDYTKNSKKGSRPSPLNKRAATSLRLEADLARAKLALHKAQSRASQPPSSRTYASAARNSKSIQQQVMLTQPMDQSSQHMAQSSQHMAQPSQLLTQSTQAMTPVNSLPLSPVAVQNLANQIVAAITAALHH